MSKEHVSILVTAQSGSGKSYLASGLIEEMKHKYKIVIDIEDEYILSGFTIITLSRKNYRGILKKLKKTIKQKRYIIIRFKDFENEEISIIVNHICKIAFHLNNVLIAIDECHEIIPKHKCPLWIRKVATTGRKHGVSSIFMTQRPQFLNTSLRTQTNIKISGKLTDENDVEAVKHSFKHWKRIPYLKERTFIYSTKRGEEYIFTTEGMEVNHAG